MNEHDAEKFNADLQAEFDKALDGVKFPSDFSELSWYMGCEESGVLEMSRVIDPGIEGFEYETSVNETVTINYDDKTSSITVVINDGIHVGRHVIHFSPQDILKILKLIPTKGSE